MFLLDYIATFITPHSTLLLLENKDKGIQDLETQKLLSLFTWSNISYSIELYRVNVSYIKGYTYQNVFHRNYVFITWHPDK